MKRYTLQVGTYVFALLSLAGCDALSDAPAADDVFPMELIFGSDIAVTTAVMPSGADARTATVSPESGGIPSATGNFTHLGGAFTVTTELSALDDDGGDGDRGTVTVRVLKNGLPFGTLTGIVACVTVDGTQADIGGEFLRATGALGLHTPHAPYFGFRVQDNGTLVFDRTGGQFRVNQDAACNSDLLPTRLNPIEAGDILVSES